MDFPSSNSQLEQVLISEGSSANFASTVRRAQMDVPRFPRGAVELQLSLHWWCAVPAGGLLGAAEAIVSVSSGNILKLLLFWHESTHRYLPF